MRVAGIQCDLVWEDPAENRRRLRPRVEHAAARGASLIALPEMWPTGFSMDADRIAEPEGGESERWMLDTARAVRAAVCGSVAQRASGGGRPRNVFLVATPAGDVHRYAKIHPFTFGGESQHYDAGDAAVTVDVGGVRVTPLVCYDLRFPELFAALAPRTDLFVVVANWPVPRVAHFTKLLEARAIETQASVLGVNRVGSGGGLDYSGGSRLVSPLGVLIDGGGAPCGTEREVSGDVTAAEVAAVRAKFPFLADRRPDVYRRLRGD